MLAAGLALVASVGYGASDFYAGILARRLPSVLIALWSQVIGLIGLGLAAAVSGQRFAPEGFALGAAGGVVAAVALVCFYRALAIGSPSVVATVAATGTLIPVGAGIAGGDAPSAPVLLGLALAGVGIALVARGCAEDGLEETQPVSSRFAAPDAAAGRPRPRGGPAPPPGRALPLAAVAAAGFGIFFVVLDAGTDQAPAGELWVIAGALVGATPTTVAAVLREGLPLRPSLALLPIAVVAGFDLVADAALTFAVAEGPLGTVSVLASLDPLVTVVLAFVVLRERLPQGQAVGVGLSLVGVVLAVAG